MIRSDKKCNTKNKESSHFKPLRFNILSMQIKMRKNDGESDADYMARKSRIEILKTQYIERKKPFVFYYN